MNEVTLKLALYSVEMASWWPVGQVWPANRFHLVQQHWPTYEHQICTCTSGPASHTGKSGLELSTSGHLYKRQGPPVAIAPPPAFIPPVPAWICLKERTVLRTMLQINTES